MNFYRNWSIVIAAVNVSSYFFALVASLKSYCSTPVAKHHSFRFISDGNNKLQYHGSDFEMLKVLATKMKFDYTIVTPTEGRWGNCDDHGKCNGLVGMVARNECDLGISSVAISPSRARFVDFSYPYTHDDLIFVTKAPDSHKLANAFFILDPLSDHVWISFVGFLAFTYIVVKLLRSFKLLDPNAAQLNTIIAVTLRQDISLNMIELSNLTRLIFILIIIVCGVITKLYECMITSTASIAPVSKPIDTVQDMLDAVLHENYVVTATQGSLPLKLLKSARTGTFKKLGDSIYSGFQPPSTVGLFAERCQKEKLALLFPRILIQKHFYNNNISLNDFHYGVDNLFILIFSIVVRKGFHEKPLLNKWLGLLVSSGHMVKWNLDDMKFRDKINENQQAVSYLEFDDLKFVFWIVLSGWLLGIIILFVENVSHVSKKR